MKTKRTDYVMVPACKCPARYNGKGNGYCPTCLRYYHKYFARTPAQVKANERNWTLKQLKMIDAAINHPILQRNVPLFNRLQVICAITKALEQFK